MAQLVSDNVGSGNNPGTTATTLVVTLTAAVPLGAQAALFSMQDGGGNLTGVADSRGNTWAVRVANALGGSLGGGIADATITTGLQVGDTITLTFSLVCHSAAIVQRWAGLGGFQSANGSVGSASPRSSGTFVSTGTALVLGLGDDFNPGTANPAFTGVAPTLTPQTTFTWASPQLLGRPGWASGVGAGSQNITVADASTGTMVVQGVAYTDNGSAPNNTGAPTVSGATPVGSTLSVTNGTWGGSPTSFHYQWTRDGVAIGGAADSSNYVSQPADVGHAVGCTVSALNAAGPTAQPSSNTITPTSAGGSTAGSFNESFQPPGHRFVPR